jgi:hypothetical protein
MPRKAKKSKSRKRSKDKTQKLLSSLRKARVVIKELDKMLRL